jgi:murein tripeptide amidase MpaA
MPAPILDHFPRHAELTDWLTQLAAEHPDLVGLTSIGRSHEGRDIWLATVTDASTGPHHAKPAVWVDANIHSIELTPTIACLHLLHHLCTATDERVRHALATRTFYVVPRVNPDGAEASLGEIPHYPRASMRPWPVADQLDGLVEEDVDRDGRQLQMRIEDANGTWKASPADRRLMVPRDPDESGPGPYYRLLPEGSVQGYDGVTIPSAPPLHALDMNRNFPQGWRRDDPSATMQFQGGGDYPASEPEVRTIVQALVDRPNVTQYFAYHTMSGVLLRPYADQSDEHLPTADLQTYRVIGDKGTQLTGYPNLSVFHDFRYNPKAVMGGSADDFAYEQLGQFAWTTEFWNPLTAAGIEDPHPIEWWRRHPEDDDLKLLAWADETHGAEGYVDWYEYDHPQLGRVELGGWNWMAVFVNPPLSALEAEVAPHTEFTVWCALVTPRLRHRDTLVERLGPTSWRVRVVVENAGWLPTNVSDKAIERKVAAPVTASLALPDGARLVAGSRRVTLGHLAGRVGRVSSIGMFAYLNDGTDDRACAEWVLDAPEGTLLPVEVGTPRAGTVRVEVELR